MKRKLNVKIKGDSPLCRMDNMYSEHHWVLYQINAAVKLRQSSSKYLKKIGIDFYVNAFITSVESLDEARNIISYASELLETTRFLLTKFTSNSEEVLVDLTSECLVSFLRTINFSKKDCMPKSIKICWDAKTDNSKLHKKSVAFGFKNFDRQKELSYLNSYLNLLGLLCQFFVHLKLYYSKIAQNTWGWNSEIIGNLRNKWKELSSEMQYLTSLFFLGRYLSLSNETYKLHLYRDATDRVWGNCVCT